MDMSSSSVWLPVVFMGLMGISMLAYVILDGDDLGVGILLRHADDTSKDVMISSIGPFWDANELGWCWVWAFYWSPFRWRMA